MIVIIVHQFPFSLYSIEDFSVSDGFRKVVKVDQGGLKVEKDDLEFQHMYFLHGQSHLLELIKRRVSEITPKTIIFISDNNKKIAGANVTVWRSIFMLISS